MDLPKISIVVPCYNAVDTISSTIKSLTSQNYPNLEIIIMDGGSTDGTVEVINKFKESITVFVSEKDRGQTHAINKGFKAATGDILNWLCADDELTAGALDKVANHYIKYPHANMYIGSCLRIFPEGIEYVTQPTEAVLDRIGYHNGIDQPASFWSFDLHKKSGELDESYHHAMDWDWWNNLKQNGAKIVLINDILAKYHFPADSKTSTGGRKQMLEMYKVIKRYGPLDGYLADIYKYLYLNFDLKGCYDKPSKANKFLLFKRNYILKILIEIFGKEYIYSYNWNFCSKQERGLCWYK